MDQIFPEAIAGLIAGVVAPIIFGLWRAIQGWLRMPGEIKLLRNIIVTKRQHILDIRLEKERLGAFSLKNLRQTYRASYYNGLLTELDVCLTNWAPNISPNRKREIYETIDWFNTHFATAERTGLQWYGIAHTGPGKWHSEQMTKEEAEKMFARLEAISWLNIPPR